MSQLQSCEPLRLAVEGLPLPVREVVVYVNDAVGTTAKRSLEKEVLLTSAVLSQ